MGRQNASNVLLEWLNLHWGEPQTLAQRYPFRVGAKWRREIIGGKYAEVVNTRFDNEQKRFLLSIYDFYKRTGVKVHEKAAHDMMVKHFNQTGEGQDCRSARF